MIPLWNAPPSASLLFLCWWVPPRVGALLCGGCRGFGRAASPQLLADQIPRCLLLVITQINSPYRHIEAVKDRLVQDQASERHFKSAALARTSSRAEAGAVD